ADYGGCGDTTAIQLNAKDKWLRIKSDQTTWRQKQEQIDYSYQIIRRTAVYALSEELELAESPIAKDICGGAGDEPVELDGLYLGLEPGRLVMVSGEGADIAHCE